MKKTFIALISFIMIICFDFSARAEVKKNPFVSIIEKKEYEEYLARVKEEQAKKELELKEKEAKMVSEELARRQRERTIVMERRLREQDYEIKESVEEGKPVVGEKEVIPDIEIQGIIFDENYPKVIINGDIYSEGQALANSVKVERIHKRKVDFIFNNDKFTKSLPGMDLKEEKGKISQETADSVEEDDIKSHIKLEFK